MEERVYRCPDCGWFSMDGRRFRGLCPACGGRIVAAECTRCGHTWMPRTPLAENVPKVCPACKSPYWNRPRQKGVVRRREDGAEA